MKRYVILRSERTRTTTRSAGLTAARASTATVSVAELNEREAAGLARDPAIKGLAPSMPTALIRPLNATPSAGSGDNWGIAAVGADSSPFTGAGVSIAVLDTGIERNHPAFAGVRLLEKDFSGDGDGDRNGHGTHCAGTIFGRNCGARIGVARGVERALVGKILDDQGDGESEWVFDAMLWAHGQGADIISMSVGFNFPGMVARLVKDGWPVELATSNALEAYRANLGVVESLMKMFETHSAFGTWPLVIAAAGNESRRNVKADFRIAASLPAAASGVVSVAAVAQAGPAHKVADFSNSMALVSAPGVDIPSAWPGGGLNTISGTSMACPHVAGVAALWWEKIRRSGVKASARNVSAQLIARASKALLAFDEADYGQGMVTAPQ